MVDASNARLRVCSLAVGLALALPCALARAYDYPAYPYGAGPYGQMPPQGPYGQMPAQGQYGQMPDQPMPWQFRPAQPDHARGTPPLAPPAAGQPQAQTPAPGSARAPAPTQGQPPGYPPGYGAPGYGPPGYQPGYAPGYQAGPQQSWPGAPGYSQTPAPRSAASPPRLEWSLDETDPYLQQTLVLRLALASPEALASAQPEIPRSGDVLIQQIAGPTPGSRIGPDGRREQETRLVLTLTPLRTGVLDLPPFRVNGTRAGGYGATEPYQAVADTPLRLQVRPPMPSVRPWLPLKSLSIKATIDRPDEIRPGEPLTLALELKAVGGGAAMLPSLEDQLASPDLRIYREQTLTDTRLAVDGRSIEGKRTEYYTLVPQAGGQLRLPEIAVAWWNVDEDAKRVARLPIRTLEVAGGGGPLAWLAALGGFGFSWGRAWVPLAAVLLVLSGYWAGILYRRGAPGERAGLGTRADLAARLRGGMRQAAGLARSGAAAAARRLKPAPLAARLRAAGLDLLPESSRLLRCVRYANAADTPIAWCERFEQAARLWLRVPCEGKVARLAERILRLRPRADRARVVRLMEQLDAALYGRQDIDFPRWKRDFWRQIGRLPGLLRPRRGASRLRRARLPELNPRPS